MIAGLYKPFQHWAEKGTVWLYSDPHFGEDNDPGLKRNITTEEQIKNINSKVGQNDTLVILGDVGDVSCVWRLRGHKVLVMGNHDRGRTNYERTTQYCFYSSVRVRSKNEALLHFKTTHPQFHHVTIKGEVNNPCGNEWWVTGDNLLFDEVYEGPLMISEKIILSHEPIDVPWAFNFHGHDHAHASKPGHFNCCAEMINYIPVSLNQLIKQGVVANIPSIHRLTINEATKRAKKHQ